MTLFGDRPLTETVSVGPGYPGTTAIMALVVPGDLEGLSDRWNLDRADVERLRELCDEALA